MLCIAACSCKKQNSEIDNTISTTQENFTKYTIEAGEHFCSNNIFISTSLNELHFEVKFDSSAIYSTIDSSNQDDINKLYGFADNNAFHQQYSARFGWRWSYNELRLFGYIYNNGVRESKELGTVEIGKKNNCVIKVTSTAYQFSLNGKIDSLPRKSTTLKAEGYKLYPYFGGDELAPHRINIFIKEL